LEAIDAKEFDLVLYGRKKMIDDNSK